MIKKVKDLKTKVAQVTIEYLLLLAAVVAIVIIAFGTHLNDSQVSSELYFNNVSVGIMGEPPRCGDGHCDGRFEDFLRCPVDCTGAGIGSLEDDGDIDF